MKKRLTLILIVLVIVTAIITIFSSWAKITHKPHADVALTAGVCFYFVTGLCTLFWYFLVFKNREPKFKVALKNKLT